MHHRKFQLIDFTQVFQDSSSLIFSLSLSPLVAIDCHWSSGFPLSNHTWFCLNKKDKIWWANVLLCNRFSETFVEGSWITAALNPSLSPHSSIQMFQAADWISHQMYHEVRLWAWHTWLDFTAPGASGSHLSASILDSKLNLQISLGFNGLQRVCVHLECVSVSVCQCVSETDLLEECWKANT